MRGKRKFSTFSLSFLDIMSCGFGAVILVFLIIKHGADTQIEKMNVNVQAEVNLLEKEVKQGKKNLVAIKNTVSQLDQKLVTTQGLARRINDEIDAIKNKVARLDKESDDQQIIALQEQLKTLVQKKRKLEDEQAKGNNARRFVGDGNRQYLTGLKLGGARILILLDTSASMLDSSLINVIRRKNMSDESKKHAEKWQRAIKAVAWLLAKFPLASRFQLYGFNTKVTPLLKNSEAQWLMVENKQQLEQSIENLKTIIPQGGTSLAIAFNAVNQLDPLPDNIILITDGLPTQGLQKPRKNTVSGPEREALFDQAVTALPEGIPVNVLLWPMEGDPMAASAFWRLAQYTSGSLMSPSRDWP